MMANKSDIHKVTCDLCKQEYVILLDRKDHERWLAGEAYIQDALSYLSAGERELLISNTCDTCWNQLYPNDGDMEDD
jgi:hypothetical protein